MELRRWEYSATRLSNCILCHSKQTLSFAVHIKPVVLELRANRIAPFLLLLLAERFALARGTCFSVASSFSGAHRKQRVTPRSEKSANSS